MVIAGKVTRSGFPKKKHLFLQRDYSFKGIDTKVPGVKRVLVPTCLGILIPWTQFCDLTIIIGRGKCLDALYSESTGGSMLFISRYSYIRPLSMTQCSFDPMTSPSVNSRSHEIIAFLPIRFDRTEADPVDGSSVFPSHSHID